MTSDSVHSEPLVHIRRIDFSYASDREQDEVWRLHAKEIRIEPRTFYSVLGPNMVGKSTLLRLVGGVDQVVGPHGNSSVDITGSLVEIEPGARFLTATGAFNASCMVLHDDPMFPELSIRDNIRLARPASAREPNSEVLQRVNTYLESIEVFRSANTALGTKLGDLSSGGKALVRLARATAWGAKLMLVDEVTAHLDSNNAALFLRGLVPFVQAEGAALLVSHQARDHQMASELISEAGLAYRTLTLSARDSVTCIAAD